MDTPLFIKLDVTLQSGRTRATVLANIARIDALINSLLTTAMSSVTLGNIVEYELDTGQTKTRTIYAKTTDITNAIMKYEKIRQFYENMLSPRVVRLVDSKNFR